MAVPSTSTPVRMRGRRRSGSEPGGPCAGSTPTSSTTIRTACSPSRCRTSLVPPYKGSSGTLGVQPDRALGRAADELAYRGLVRGEDVVGVTRADYAALVDHRRVVGELSGRLHVMCGQQKGRTRT